MPSNRFSDVDYGKVSNWRRVGHSASNYFSSIDRSSVSASGALSTVTNVGGVAAGVGGAMAIQMTGAAIGGLATAGFLVAIAGPQVAVTAAVVGLALAAKDMYSNREAAHTAISEYVWSMIDDERPRKDIDTEERLKEAAEAALTLMNDGKNQIKLLGTKMKEAQLKFDECNHKFKVFHGQLLALRADKAQAKRVAVQFVASIDGQIIALKAKAQALWDKEVKSGGAIFDYVRRCSHTANYLQAPGIIALWMSFPLERSVLRPGQSRPDFFLGFARATDLRKFFAEQEVYYAALSSPEPP